MGELIGLEMCYGMAAILYVTQVFLEDVLRLRIIIMYNYVYSILQTEFTNEIRREFSIRAGVCVSLFEDWYKVVPL